MKTNNIKYYINSSAKSLVLLFTSGGLVQAFFHQIGFSASQISSYAALTSAIQVIVMILNLVIADKVKKVRKLSAVLNLSPIIFCVTMLTFCTGITSVDTAFKITMFLCTVLNIFQGINGVLVYRLVYVVLDMKEYAKIENNALVINGILSISASFLISALSSIFNYTAIMVWGFVASIIFTLASSIAVSSMKENNMSEPESKKGFVFSKLKKPAFVYFYAPNFVRGLSMGVMNVISVICINSITSNQTFVSGLVTIFSVSSIAGGLLYNTMVKKISTAKMYMLTSAGMLILMPFMVMGHSPLVFGTLYLFVSMFFNIGSIAAAVQATEVVDYYDMGTFTSSRLILMSLGQTISGIIISAVIGKIPTYIILAAGGLMQFMSGYFTWLWDIKFSKR